ncbi:hypothetical protein NXS08_00705 [Gleimia sp. 6138-11-ORH1]|uniref:hypothetical protein n=1 Tax=Gleimia sp. 6138-11-ORH1 TaxID=2973937 RepID=UPI00216A64F4|nr:hypothetical protein [Gleimia sp. 6138-11-ORH1]MCS4484011.1 hypothetical protein [Gleimia sp. 6138-11-ORH1]
MITPIMEVLPLLLLGATYLNAESQRPYIYTNMIWSFFAAVVIQCLVSIQGISSGGRLDTFLQSEGNLISWLLGYALGVCGFYLVSSLISTAILGMFLGFPIVVGRMLLFAVLSVPVTLGIVCFVYGFEIRFNRTFHFINLILDILQILSCVLWPLVALNGLIKMGSLLSPFTYLNEFVRTNSFEALAVCLFVSALFVMIGMAWVTRSTTRYRERGKIGGER